MTKILDVTRLFGSVFVLVGGALTLTLWLMPLGLPLALLGVAMMSSRGN